eukprot:UC4_evm1s1556
MLDELVVSATQVQEKVNAWCDSRVASAQEDALTHTNELATLEADLNVKKAELAALESQVHRDSDSHIEQDRVFTALQREIADLTAQTTATRQRHSDLQAQVDDVVKRKAELMKQEEQGNKVQSCSISLLLPLCSSLTTHHNLFLPEKTSQNSVSEDALANGLHFYETRLGLRFEREGDDGLRFIFTCIDSNDWDREFAFTVVVSPSDEYKIPSCSPAVDGISTLLTTLNTNNDFAAFVRSMRTKFKDYCSAEK